MDETDLSTQRSQARQDARVSQEDVNQGGTSGDPRPPGQGPSASLGLIAGSGHRSPRVGRIESRDTFLALRRSSYRGRSGPIAVRYVTDDASGAIRAAYAINRKVGNAVVRNRLRRRMRAIVTSYATDLPAGAYVISTDPSGAVLRYEELRAAMGQALERAVRRSAGSVDALATPGGPR